MSAADWIVDRLHRFPAEVAGDVGSFVPDDFQSYARILHPAWRIDGGRHVKVHWADLARTAGDALQPATRFEELEAIATANETEPPLVGSLEESDLDALVDLLAGFTSSPQWCWFGVWEGYGWMQGPPAIRALGARRPGGEHHPTSPQRDGLPTPAPAGPRVQIPDRALALYSGPIEAAAAFCRPPASQSPNLWWPEDRAWCIASEIDFRSTYVGGVQALIDRVLHDERLEALPARSADRATD